MDYFNCKCCRDGIERSNGEDVCGQLLQRRGEGLQVRWGDVGPRGPARAHDQSATGVDRKTGTDCHYVIYIFLQYQSQVFYW